MFFYLKNIFHTNLSFLLTDKTDITLIGNFYFSSYVLTCCKDISVVRKMILKHSSANRESDT